jgi:outer membrane protein OmpA-like peptidoglycan-associated protein
MKKTTIGALLLLLLGVAVVVTWSVLQPVLFEKHQKKTSDAPDTSLSLRIGGDNYLGYWFITSPQMRKLAAQQGIEIEFTDDGGAYAERLEKFHNKEYDCIVLPVNSYLEHGEKYDYPGVIVASISESKGADGIVGFRDKLPTGKIEKLNDPLLKIVYTRDSPSSFLLDLTISDFDFYNLENSDSWRVPVDSSREVLERAKKQKGDVFVLWEDDLSKALELPGMQYLWGSDKFSGYIIDVFVLRRDFLDKHKNEIVHFFRTYFRVLSIYSNNQDIMIEEMKKTTGLRTDTIKKIFDKIEWFDLHENCRFQFGISTQIGENAHDGLMNTIIACTDVMLRTGTLKTDPLKGNPYLITNSTILEELIKASPARLAVREPGSRSFKPLDEQQWTQLRQVGTMRVEPIIFQSWNNLLSPEGKEKVDKIAQMLINNYPDYYVAVRGHTGSGDEDENLKISKERAQAVVQYLTAVHNIDPNRLKAEGWADRQKPPKKPGESERAYRYRLSRVEFVLFERNVL